MLQQKQLVGMYVYVDTTLRGQQSLLSRMSLMNKLSVCLYRIPRPFLHIDRDEKTYVASAMPRDHPSQPPATGHQLTRDPKTSLQTRFDPKPSKLARTLDSRDSYFSFPSKCHAPPSQLLIKVTRTSIMRGLGRLLRLHRRPGIPSLLRETTSQGGNYAHPLYLLPESQSRTVAWVGHAHLSATTGLLPYRRCHGNEMTGMHRVLTRREGPVRAPVGLAMSSISPPPALLCSFKPLSLVPRIS